MRNYDKEFCILLKNNQIASATFKIKDETLTVITKNGIESALSIQESELIQYQKWN